MVTHGLDSLLVDGALARFDRLFARMEAQLERTPWLAGATYSLADIGLTAYVHRMNMIGFSPLWTAGRPKLTAWFARLR